MLEAQSSTTVPSRTLWARAAVVAVISLIAAMLGFASPTYAASGSATFVSDQADYPPGGTVVLSGDGWASGESVHITVNDDAGQTWSLSSGTGTAPADPVANDTGSFSYTFTLPAWFVANYTATATGATTGTLTTTFTDSAVKTFDQCANDLGSGYPAASSDPACQWINGNLQQSNSVYNEGDATPQRLALTGLTAGTSYALVFTYQTSKGGLHAYDYLTTYNFSETWINDQCQGLSPCSIAGATTYPIPTTTPQSGGQLFTMYGGTMTNATIAMPSSYAGDTTATVTLTFTASGADSVLWFGAHVASQLDWGNGQGAGSISGSPYHVSLVTLNGASLGSQDNQMASGAVQTAGSVTIIKDAVPNSAQDFSFTLANGTTSTKTFSLDDDSDPALPNTQTYNVAPGTWTITENPAVSPWSLTNLTCSGGTYTVSGSTATLTVVSGQTITCTYTNNFVYKNLVVTKTAAASYDRSYTWTITKEVDQTTVNTTSGGTATFNYRVTATPTAHDSNFTVSGTISVNNPNTVPVPAVSLVDSISGGGTCSITGTTTNFSMAAGATATFGYTCTYTSKPSSVVTNTATATWTAGSPFGTSGSASGTATADFSTVTPNVTGGQTILVTDDKTDPSHPVVLGTADATVASTQTYTYALTKTAGAGCTSYTNTAWLGTDTTHPASQTVTVCGGAALDVSKTAVPSYTRDWTWSVTKVASQDRVYADPATGLATANYTVTATPTSTDSAWAVAGVITVHNPNTVGVTGLSVTDSLPGASCTIDTVPTSLAAGATATISYTCTFSSNPGTATLTNTVTATWADSGYVKGGTAVNTATATFLGLKPTTETGTTTQVTDPKATSGLPATATAPAGGQYNVTAQWTVTKPGTCQRFDNTASVTGDSDTASVEVCRGADLTVTKDASTSYTRTYDWTIAKAAGEYDGAVPAGAVVGVPFTVTVSKNGYVDSSFATSGTITVTNPNTFMAVTATLSDTLTGIAGGSCSPATTSVTVPAGESVEVHYTCDFAETMTSDTIGSNTATVTWEQSAVHSPSGAVTSAAAAVAFGAPSSEVNDQITVTDTQQTDPWLVDWAAAKDSTSFTYTIPVTAPPGSCATIDNTAAITQIKGATAHASAKVCGGSNLSVTKTAKAGYTQTYPWTVTKDASRTKIVVADGGNTDVTYTVTPAVGTATPTAWTLTGQITVTNPNDWESITAQVSDSVNISGLTCSVIGGTDVAVAAGKSVTLDYSCSVAAGGDPGTLSGTNTATATWDAAAASTSKGSATGTADVTGTLTGSINETVHVMDSMFGGELGTATAGGTLTATGAGVTVSTDGKSFVYTKTLTGTAGQCQTIDNTASITGTGASDTASVELCIVKAITASKSGSGTFTRTYPWTITKDVNTTQVEIAPDGTATFHYTVTATQGTPVDSAWALSGKITVTNPNAFAATATVTDNLSGCTVSGSPVTVAANSSADLAYTCSGLTSAVTANSASVTWTATTDAGGLNGSTTASGSGFTYTETTSVDKSIDVYDNLTGTGSSLLGTASWSDGITPVTFHYDVTKSGADIAPGTCATYDNKAWVKTGGNDSSDTQQVKVCVGADLVVTKTATGSYDTTYLWTIDKAAGSYTGNTTAGTVVTVPYTVTATNTGHSDANWVVSGTITVTNPNTWESVTLQSVSDSLSVVGATCAIVGDQTATIAAGGSVKLTYRCTYAAKPADYAGTNTATATWDKAAAYTANGTASGSAAYTLALAGETNRTITVSDTYEGVTTTLGTATIAESPRTFTYSHGVTAPTGSCTTVHNTATIVETGATASASATVCGAAPITADKSASGRFDRQWDWAIKKTASASAATDANGNVVASYTVTVTPTKTDSNAVVSGSITVHNPNSVDITVAVTDSMLGKACTITSADRLVPAKGQLVVTYSCALDSVPTGVVTNTADVTWPATAYVTAGELKPTATLDFATVSPMSSGNPVQVTDPVAGWANDVTTVYAGDGSATKLTYTHTYHVAAGQCATFPNMATIVGTDISSSADVTSCHPVAVTATKSVTTSYDRDYSWTLKKTVNTNRIDTTAGADATFTYTVTATPTVHDSGFSATGSIVVTNPNYTPLTGVTVTEKLAGCTVTGNSTGLTVPAATSGGAGTLTVPVTCSFTSATNATNTATVSWATSEFVPAGSVDVSGAVTFGNPSTISHDSYEVTDDKTTGTQAPLFTAFATVASTWSTSYPVAVQAPNGGCADYTNVAKLGDTTTTASQTVTVCGAAAVTAVKDATGTFKRAWTWTIAKATSTPLLYGDASGNATASYSVTVTPSKTDSGAVVSGTITVTNPNGIALPVTVADTMSGATCSVTYPNGTTVPAKGTLAVSYSCALTSVPTGVVKNTATVSWVKTDYVPAGSLTPSATVDFGAVKPVVSGDGVTFTDPASPNGSDTAYGPFYGADGAKTTTYTHTWYAAPGTCTTNPNTATLSSGGSSSATVKVCTGAPLQVAKTVTTSLTRTYLWTIAKKAPKGTSYGPTLASTVTVPYTVTVSPNGYTDSKWAASGTITVTNPNDWESVTVKSVTDQLDAAIGGTCTVTNGTTAKTLTAKGTTGATATWTYSCTFAGKPSSYTGTNTATATWDATAAHTATGSVTGTAAVNFEKGTITPVNQLITVTDQVAGSTTIKTLGTVDWFTGIKTLGAGVTGTIGGWVFSYSTTYAVPAQACTTYTNTAKISQTGQTSAVTVKVCGPPQLGDGTIGFWQNKNGQALITGGKSTNGVCNVTTWLRQFAPFQDLSATATCAQVAAYVSTILKAATASGAAMNAMLKAQMLAAALNYYYTTIEPTRNAPSGSLSLLTFDISQWSAAFGGATQMTLLQMLKYASLQSNVGGSVWYGQNKTLQGLAKDAFAAINMSRILVV